MGSPVRRQSFGEVSHTIVINIKQGGLIYEDEEKRWLIPLLVLFIGIILPIKTHAMELKDTDESVTKTSSSHICKDKKMKGEFLWKILY